MLNPVLPPFQLSRAAPFADPAKFDVMGDSRMDQITVSPSGRLGWSANNFLVQANILAGHRYKVGVIGATSGYRSDQYIAAWLQTVLASNSGWLLIGFPAVNDLLQATSAPYTNILTGAAVTIGNAAAQAASNIQYAAQQALNAGKKVIICAEPGATPLNAAQVAALHELNLRNRAFAEVTPGVFYFSANTVLWNAAASATLIGFKPGYINMADGTHYTVLGGYYAGKIFNTFMSSLVPYSDLGPCSINDVQTANPRQLIQNALFNTLTGGTHSGSGILTSGNIPASINVGMPLSTTSCAVTSSADPNGFGNDVTFALTFGASDTATIAWTGVGFTLGDTLEGGFDFTVAAGASNTAVYAELAFVGYTGAGNTNPASAYSYDGYVVPGTAGIDVGPGSSEAYAGRMRTKPVNSIGNNGVATNWLTPAYAQLQCAVYAQAAGSMTLTLSRPTLDRRF